ncbi:ABC transporter permease [Myxococcus sp. Y35]|uniref:ABC transporter permease n=1 Tax=Pseudomyxococcus flavus TaxID=3115648 RepID=UPI003CEB31C5
MASFFRDLRYGARSLRRSPGFTLATVLALALGIGANTTLFSVVSALLLRPLPLPQPERLVAVWGQEAERGAEDMRLSRPDVEALRQKTTALTGLAAYATLAPTLTGPGLEPERVEAVAVGEDFFRVMGVPPLLGRGLSAEEQVPDGPRAVVLSHGLWARRFGSDPRVLERRLEMDGQPYQVVGVMPPGFDFPREGTPDALALWAPLYAKDSVRNNWDHRGAHMLQALGRLAPGVSASQAQDELGRLIDAVAREHGDTSGRASVGVEALQRRMSADMRRPALLLLGAVGLLLLIACVNVAQLLLARALARQQEFAIRTALGAGRSALVRQLLAEGSLLALGGGLLGLLLGVWGVGGLNALLPEDVLRVQAVEVDERALAYTAGLSIVVALLCGLAPLGTAVNANLGGLIQSTRGTSASRGALRWRAVLVSTQVALALILLAGAGLLVRSSQRLAEVDPGYQAEGVSMMPVTLPIARYELAEAARFQSQLLERVRALPGVDAAGWMIPGVVSGSAISIALDLPGKPFPPDKLPDTSYRAVSDGIFTTLGIPLRQGRDFTPADGADASPVVVVNESFARRYFPGEDIIGKSIAIGYGEMTPRQVVGVVGDIRSYSLDAPAKPEVYAPLAQTPWRQATLMVRSRLAPSQVAAAVKPELRQLDSQLSLAPPVTLARSLDQSVAGRSFQRVLLLTFAVTALALASLGLYGLMAYSVAQRRRELGIRLALGAMPGDVVRLVMRQALRLTATGLAVGLGLGFVVSRLLEGLLYGVSASDPLTFGAVALLLLGVMALASWLPARRASRVSPGVAMTPD